MPPFSLYIEGPKDNFKCASEQPSLHPKPSRFLTMRTCLIVNPHHRRLPDGSTPSRSAQHTQNKPQARGPTPIPPPLHLTQDTTHLAKLKTDTQMPAAITTALPKTKPYPITHFDGRSVRRSSRITNRGGDKIVKTTRPHYHRYCICLRTASRIIPPF